MTKIVHKQPEKLIEIQQNDYKEIQKHLRIATYVLEGHYCDHIASNIYQKNRNFSFNAAISLLRSPKIRIFKHTDRKDGYIAIGFQKVVSADNFEDKYQKDSYISVVFKLKFNKRLLQKEVSIITGWSELDKL